MNKQTFKKILRCWTWEGGQRFRMTFTADTVSSMGCYGAAGINVSLYGYTDKGKRIKLEMPCRLNWNKITGLITVD